MELRPVLEPIQNQRQTFNSVQVQSLKILQMPVADLLIKIEEELEKNPLLDWSDDTDENSEDSSFVELKDSLQPDKNNYANDYSLIVKEVFTDYPCNNSNGRNIKNELCLENFITKEETFKDYLLGQLVDIKTEKKILSVCKFLIECLNNKGYLDCEIQDISEFLKVSDEIIIQAVKLVQTLQPRGVCARNLKECLTLQLKEHPYCNDTLLNMVTNCLEIIAENKIKEIAKLFNLDLNTTVDYCSIIKSLEPIPSRGFNTGTAKEYILPEAYIGNDNNGLYIQINYNSNLKLHINQNYKKMLRSSNDETARQFLHRNLTDASAFIKDIRSRDETMLKIISKIAELQKEYFNNGSLKPMKISNISQSIAVHESTVSRAIQNKYISCCHGTISIKSLFTTSIGTIQKNENVSSKCVKSKIINLIKSENKFNPLSDYEISEHLKDFNISISRRTVAKYREELEISSSSKRKAFG